MTRKPESESHSGLRSNSFHYVPQVDLPRRQGAPCPLRADPALFAQHAKAPLQRHLWVQLADRMRLCRTDTRDFDEGAIATVKDRTGQLYADVSRKSALDDFERDLTKLVQDAECGGCERRLVCARCFRGSGKGAFSRDDQHVRALLRDLRGTVIDLGAGHAPYADCLQDAAKRGVVRYMAVEPDPQRAEALRRRLPWAEVIAVRAEEVPVRDVDHILVLRSYNHLAEPAQTLTPLVERLAVGGTLLVVDNAAFAVVRSSAQARAAEDGPAAFEHFRNDTAAEAEARLASLGMELVERRDVGPETSNQWLLRYRKALPVGPASH